MKKSFLLILGFSLFLISGGHGTAQVSQIDSVTDSENTNDRGTEKQFLLPPPPRDFNENDNDEFNRPPPPPRDFNENNSSEYDRAPAEHPREFIQDRRENMNEHSNRHHGKRHDRPSRGHGHKNREKDV